MSDEQNTSASAPLAGSGTPELCGCGHEPDMHLFMSHGEQCKVCHCNRYQAATPRAAPAPAGPRQAIQRLRGEQDRIQSEIDRIASAHIPDFHFLDYSVSTFWTCKDSPIGMCVFALDNYGRKTLCRYCHGPEERK